MGHFAILHLIISFKNLINLLRTSHRSNNEDGNYIYQKTVFSIFFPQEKAVSEKKEDNIPLKERISNQLAKKEVETFYAAFLVWTIIMLIMSYYRLASAHLPLLFIIFPLIIRVVIWDNVLTAKTSHENVGAFLFMYLLATLVPVQFCMYLTFAMFDVFMPIMGRAGTQTPPDVFISVLCAFGVVLLTSYMVSVLSEIRSIC